MAIPVNIDYNIQTASASATNGGGFVRGGSGTNKSLSTAVARTDVVIDGSDSTKISSAGTAFDSTDVDNLYYQVSGTGFTVGRFHIVSVAAGVATLDRSAGTLGSTGGTSNLGGALLINMGDVFYEATTDGTRYWTKGDGVHTLTASISIAQDGTLAAPCSFMGYSSTFGDAHGVPANRPTIACGAYDINLDNYWQAKYLNLTGSSTTRVLRLDINGQAFEVKVTNTSGGATSESFDLRQMGAKAESCEAINSSAGQGFFVSGAYTSIINCKAEDCDEGIHMQDLDVKIYGCIIQGCLSGIEMTASADGNDISKCIFYDCTKGIYESNVGALANHYHDNNFVSCTTGHERVTSEDPVSLYSHNNFHDCGTDTVNTDQWNKTTVDPDYADPANGDFTPGVAMDGTGYPAKIGDTTTHFAQGAIAYRNTGGGGGGLTRSIFDGSTIT